MSDAVGLSAVYIGEAENVCRRLAGYLAPGSKQQTNIRIKQGLDERKAAGAAVQFQLLEFSPFRINGVVASRETLTSSYIRKLVENLAIALCLQERIILLNRGTDLADKTLDKIFKLIPESRTEERNNFIRSAKELLAKHTSSVNMRTEDFDPE